MQVVDAFAVPRVQYDPVRKLFHRSSVAPQLQADAQVRHGLFVAWGSSTCQLRPVAAAWRCRRN